MADDVIMMSHLSGY